MHGYLISTFVHHWVEVLQNFAKPYCGLEMCGQYLYHQIFLDLKPCSGHPNLWIVTILMGRFMQHHCNKCKSVENVSWHYCKVTTIWGGSLKTFVVAKPVWLVYTETKMSSFWRNFNHWLHWKLSFWQLPLQPVMKISSKWRHFRFSVTSPCISTFPHLSQGCCTTMHCCRSGLKIYCDIFSTVLSHCIPWALSVSSLASQDYHCDFAGICNAIAVTLHIAVALHLLHCLAKFAVLTQCLRANTA